MPPISPSNGNSAAIPSKESISTRSIYKASSLAAIHACLVTLHSRDGLITSHLNGLISSQADLTRELGRLDLLRAHLGSQVVSTRDISNVKLDSAASTASHLSSKVKELDLEKKRVEETLIVVEQVAELKACVQGVMGSMGAPQDWEAAAGYIARANKIPRSIIEGKFAITVVPSVEVPDPPGITIESAKESLCGLFLREFEKAAEVGDGGKVTRFFKLFPLIGREDTGLEVYGRYICQGVASQARTNIKEGTKGRDGKERFFYANALTKLFENVARIVENHGGLVERYYGDGRMVRVIERLQAEADVQGGIVLDTWRDERGIDRRLTDVKSYPFSFLVQSFLPAQKSSGLSRTNSPTVGGGANGRTSEDEGVDTKEVDGLLSEMAVMLGRWSLYSRFLAGKCRDPETNPEEPLVVPDLLVKSALGRKISENLITPFNIMTTFFFRRSVEKAFQLDELPSGLSLNMSKALEGGGPFIISAVDDIMYIVNAVLQRSLSTSQRDVVASVTPTISRVLGSDFVGMVQRKMDESYPKSLIQGGFAPESKVITFVVLINSLDVANDYISRIVTSCLRPHEQQSSVDSLAESFPFSRDSTFVMNALENLNTTFNSKISDLITDGLRVLDEQVIRPRLRPILIDTFRDVDYSLTEEDLADLALQNDSDGDPDSLNGLVARRFEHSWDALMKPIQRLMTPGTFSRILDKTAEYLAKFLEKRMWVFGGRMNVLGASRMERDFSGIVNVVAKGGRYAIREKFSRITQIAMLFNMEKEEWEALLEEEDEIVWALNLDERIKARALVGD